MMTSKPLVACSSTAFASSMISSSRGSANASVFSGRNLRQKSTTSPSMSTIMHFSTDLCRNTSRAVDPSPPPPMYTVFGFGCISIAGCTSDSWYTNSSLWQLCTSPSIMSTRPNGCRSTRSTVCHLDLVEASTSLRPYETRRPGSSSSSTHLDIAAWRRRSGSTEAGRSSAADRVCSALPVRARACARAVRDVRGGL